MNPIRKQRLTAEMDGAYVVFLVGMRVNRPWKVWKWWPVLKAMVGMIGELYRHPELGLLGHHAWFSRTILVLQYWKSHEHLLNYASMADQSHLPQRIKFNRAIGSNGDVGIWHETYLVDPGKYETIYHNMPAFGLGKVGVLHEATGARAAARGRLAAL